MKKRFTKTLALLLSAMLIIGLAPTAFAADSEETLDSSGVKIVYDLGLYNANVNTQTFETTSGFWEYAGSNQSNMDFVDHYDGIQIKLSANSWWAVKVYVPKEGRYNLEMSLITHKWGGQTDVYFGKATEPASLITEEKKVNKNSVNFYAANSTTTYESTNVGTIEVEEPGVYTVVFKATAAGDGSEPPSGTTYYARQFLQQLIFDGNENGQEIAAVMGTVNIGGSNRIKAKQTGAVSVETFDSITAEEIEIADEVTYTSSDDTILSVSGNTATAHRAGTVTLTASSESWANDVASTIIVDPELDYSGIKVVYSTLSSPAEVNASIEETKYIDTNGFWKFAGKNAGDIIDKNQYHGVNAFLALNEWWAMSLYVPVAGSYKLSLNHSTGEVCGTVGVYFDLASKAPEEIVNGTYVKSVPFYANTSVTLGKTSEIGIIEIAEPGEYTIIFKAEAHGAGGKSRQYIKQVILDGCTGDEKTYVPMLNVTADKNVITDGETATVTATSALMSDGTTTITNPEITYTSNGVVTVDNSGNVTTNKDGIATVTATATVGGKSSSRSVNITVNNKDISNAFNAVSAPEEDYIAPSVTGITVDGTAITPDKNSDGSYNLTAPETKAESAFLYWAMGMSANKRIVSFDATLSNYVPEGNGVNYLVPVYADDVSEEVEEYYNLNGQRIAALPVGTAAPALPEIPGLGGAKKWKQCAENVYVAEYESTVYNKVTVNEEEVDYGTKIECKADANEGTFRFWKKTVNGKEEVVSLEPEYTFYAWENTTVTAEYGDDAPMFTGEKLKIIIDSFDVNGETGVMAEFIGLSDAVEKGIMFTDTASSETRKMAMTTKDKQFTVIANMLGTYTGYAIVGDEANGYTLITDGEYTKQ